MRSVVAAFSLALAAQCATAANVRFADKWKIFCGEPDCYDELSLLQNATKAQIRKEYRKLSMQFHPDKNIGDEAAAARFKRIARANEVLTSDEDRKKLDYYIENPSEYWSLYGNFVEFSYAPKTSMPTVLLVILVFISLLLPTLQYSKYIEYVKGVQKAALSKASERDGGTPESMDVRRRAEAIVAKDLKAKQDASTSGKTFKLTSKQEKDALEAAINRICASLEVANPNFRKPELKDLFLYKVVSFPFTSGGAVLDRGKVEMKLLQGAELTETEQQEVLERLVGGADAWEALDDAEQDQLFAGECWKSAKFAAWTAARAKPAGLSIKSKKELRQRKQN
ncbi:hypothetical protein M885DRAFT_621645 [Pelagophyceae sp. CCMP2097]|nr:hypothetical protein M885DRAFT_621645 [Pelagophyceae sp. CCMP2097]